jgi:8-oxo-dGTP pyrophosphatase MutT (NUDIX family)
VHPDQPIRDAAAVVLVRRGPEGPRVLMGQRGAAAIFMPDKFVFPGGAVDREDAGVWGETALEPDTARRLALDGRPELTVALPVAAIRELWEETGLRLAHPAGMPDVAGWQGFGLRPRTEALRLVFRAITPPGRPRRFDARFFLADAEDLADPPDDFSAASDELRHLQWIGLDAARHLPLPFVTEVVLSEIAARLADPDPGRPVPFFEHTAEGSRFRML